MNRERTAHTTARSPITNHRSRIGSRLRTNAFTLPKRHERFSAFTLAELLVSMGVLVLLVLLFTQLVNSAATVTILGHKRMDADSEARQVFDRMAVDFAQMLKRTDVSYYVKNFNQIGQNDQIAFYSAVPGYYPSSGAKSSLSLVAYRVNSDSTSPAYNKLERLGKGLVWNGASINDTPAVFLPLTISNTWPYATNQNPDPSSPSAYEVIGPDVFRFEYFFQLGGALSESPCTGANCALNAWRQVTAIVVDIAVIDPRSKVLLTDQQIAGFNSTGTPFGSATFLDDYASNMNRPGALLNRWQTRLNGVRNLPRQAISGIRVYERYFYINQ
jgi:hypothetical protein